MLTSFHLRVKLAVSKLKTVSLSHLQIGGFLFKGNDWSDTEHVYYIRCSKEVIFGTRCSKLYMPATRTLLLC
jgi:hypothetical protein